MCVHVVIRGILLGQWRPLARVCVFWKTWNITWPRECVPGGVGAFRGQSHQTHACAHSFTCCPTEEHRCKTPDQHVNSRNIALQQHTHPCKHAQHTHAQYLSLVHPLLASCLGVNQTLHHWMVISSCPSCSGHRYTNHCLNALYNQLMGYKTHTYFLETTYVALYDFYWEGAKGCMWKEQMWTHLSSPSSAVKGCKRNRKTEINIKVTNQLYIQFISKYPVCIKCNHNWH